MRKEYVWVGKKPETSELSQSVNGEVVVLKGMLDFFDGDFFVREAVSSADDHSEGTRAD